jgi:hypothetical protein
MRNIVLALAASTALLAVPAAAKPGATVTGEQFSGMEHQTTRIDNRHTMTHDVASVNASSATGFSAAMTAQGVDTSAVHFSGTGIAQTISGGIMGNTFGGFGGIAGSTSFSSANYSGNARGSVNSGIDATVMNFAQSGVNFHSESFAEFQTLRFQNDWVKEISFKEFNK